MKKINVKTARANKINHSTEMVFILDRSGSMAGLESDTIGGFNLAKHTFPPFCSTHQQLYFTTERSSTPLSRLRLTITPQADAPHCLMQ